MELGMFQAIGHAIAEMHRAVCQQERSFLYDFVLSRSTKANCLILVIGQVSAVWLYLFAKITKQAVRVATQYASAPCKLTISSHLFARWHLFRHVGYLTY